MENFLWNLLIISPILLLMGVIYYFFLTLFDEDDFDVMQKEITNSSKHDKYMLGKDLIFISNIGRKGTELHSLINEDMSHCDDTKFAMNCLSITHGTWIASEFNSYVVKLKSPN